MKAGLIQASISSANRPLVTTCRCSQPFGLFSYPRKNKAPAQLAKGTGTEFLTPAKEFQDALVKGLKDADRVVYQGVHHVGLLVEDLERSLAFYQGVLGLELNKGRPDNKLPYAGAWLWIGSEMIHLMVLPNPDTLDLAKRPQHGGRDRHVCIGVQSISPLVDRLEKAGVQHTKSMSGRPAIFFRDPDANVLEVAEMGSWRE